MNEGKGDNQLDNDQDGNFHQTQNTAGAKLPSIEDFDFIKPISRGAFGKVFLGRKKGQADKLYAIKVMKKMDMVNKNLVGQVTAERDALAFSESPFIVQLFYSFQTRENIFLVMEYLIGGDVKSLLSIYGYFDEEMAILYAAEVTLALEYLHSKGIIHRDLKPDNMLVTDQGHIKLTDFGLSKITLDISRMAHDTTRTPLPYSRQQNSFRTPGQILSLKSSLVFTIPSNKQSLSRTVLESPASSVKKERIHNPLKELSLLNSPLARKSSRTSLRDKLISQSTLNKLMPPVKSLTPTLQDSLNWSSSENSSFFKKIFTPKSTLSQCSSVSTNLSIAFSSDVDDVFDSSKDTSGALEHERVCEKCTKAVISVNIEGRDVGPHCECHSHLKAPSRQESITDDTPQMHRSNESVWNSYAARNLRSMRHGSYSEESDELEGSEKENGLEGDVKDERSDSDSPVSVASGGPVQRLRAERPSSASSQYSYPSDDETEHLELIKQREQVGKKRGFHLVEKSPGKVLTSSRSGLTQDLHVLYLYGDEHRHKRSNSSADTCVDASDCVKHYETDIHSYHREFTCLTGENVHMEESEMKRPLDKPKSALSRRVLDRVVTSSHMMSSDSHSGSSVGRSLLLTSSSSSERVPSSSTCSLDDSPFLSPPRNKKGDVCRQNDSVSRITDVDSNSSEDMIIRNQGKCSPVKMTRFNSKASFHTLAPRTPASKPPAPHKTPGHCRTPAIQRTPAPHRTPALARTPAAHKTPYRTPKSVRRGREHAEEQRILGTPDYLAPEILLQKAHGPGADWWALGVCLFEFLTGVPPFNDQTPDLVFENILNKDIPWPDDSEALSADTQSAIDLLLTMDPEKRPTAKNVKSMPLFSYVDWDHLLELEPPFVPQPDDETDTAYFEARNTMQDLIVSGIDHW